ncbi:MAG: DNA polymerase-3 subunit epsilon [Saprospiraceae bacterium]|jgi:DNA polymerase-3 subunit epsilon
MQMSFPWNLDFVAIDFETAMSHHICSVGIVTVENGEITDEYHALIQPPENEYNYHTIKVHGITPQDTLTAPTFYQIYPEIEKRLKGRTVVAHNEKFDRNVLIKTMRDNSMDYEMLNLPAQWECTLKIYRKKGYKPANLNACCQVHGIALNHHDALSDAVACAKLYMIQ